MIYFATVHWNTAQWIDIQVSYIHKYTPYPHRIFGWLNNIPDKYFMNFDRIRTDNITSHPLKLNLLARMICEEAKNDDLLVFVDGDAFPVAFLDDYLDKILDRYPLLAVCRFENSGESQPHPCFCATTVGFWKRIGGDWRPRHPWRDLRGRPVYDAGGTLKHLIEGAGYDWYRMKRTRGLGNHHVFFGVYDDRVYHHGAGFRAPVSRIDIDNGKGLLWLFLRLIDQSQIPILRKSVGSPLMLYLSRKNKSISESVFTQIQTDPNIFARLSAYP